MSHDHGETWNPLEASVLDDQRSAYDRMREQCPVAHSKLMSWSLFRHDDIVAVVDDPATFINTARFPAIPNGLNPPEHGPYNAALAAFFSPGHMAQLEPQVRRLATRQLEPLCKAGAAEFVDAFALPFVFGAACVLLGWPEQEREPLAHWADGNARVAFSGDAAAGKELADLFTAQVLRNLDAHRNARAAAPASPDATDRLLLTEVNGKRLRDDEIERTKAQRRCVSLETLVMAAAEQHVQRETQRLAGKIPERDVEAADGVHDDAVAAESMKKALDASG
jgi:cytochrome P450